MATAAALEGLQERLGAAVEDVVRFRGEGTAVLRVADLIDACLYCRDALGYNFLSDLTCVDWLDRDPRFEVVYHLTSLNDWSRLRLKVRVNEGHPVPTVCSVWPAANWAEREVFDLFGILFDGHPDMRRILLPEGWVGYPLRKDYPQSQISLPRPKVDKIDKEL